VEGILFDPTTARPRIERAFQELLRVPTDELLGMIMDFIAQAPGHRPRTRDHRERRRDKGGA